MTISYSFKCHHLLIFVTLIFSLSSTVVTSRRTDDELLKQSQSSNFFSNSKNKGKEDFDDAYEKATKSSPSAKNSKARGRNRGKSKFRNSNSISSSLPVKADNFATQKPVTTFTTPIVVQPLSSERTHQGQTHNSRQQSSNFRSVATSTLTPVQSSSALPQPRKIDETFFDVPKASPKTTAKPKQQQQTQAPAQPPAQSSFGFFGAIPQRVIIPSQLSPEQRLALQQSNGKSLILSTAPTSTTTAPHSTSTTHPTHTQQQHNTRHTPAANHNHIQQQKSSKDYAILPQKFNFKTQKYESANEPLNPTTQFYNPKYETKGTEPPPYNNAANFDSTRDTLRQHSTNNRTTSISHQQQRHHENHNEPTTFNPQQYYQSEHSQHQTLTPRGFSLAAKQQQQQQHTPPQTKSTPAQQPPQKITSRAESVRSHKKFSTLVPKDQYYPTTFKPANGAFSKKAVDVKFEKSQNLKQQVYTQQPQQFTASSTQAPVTQSLNTSPFPHFNLPAHHNLPQQQQQFNNFDQQTTRLTNFYSTSTAPRALREDEEDDGQYRPELYEKDFYRNKVKTTKVTAAPVKNNVYQSSTTLKPAQQQQPQQQQNNFANDEDELFKTAHSQNIFASGNQLRAEKEREKTSSKVPDYSQFAEKSSPRPFSKPTQPPATPKSVVAPPKKKLTEKLSVGGEKDVSYDYQYYDSDNLSDYSELGAAIEDFGKVKKISKKN